MSAYSRRHFLQIASALTTCTLLPGELRARAVSTPGSASGAIRLDTGWQFFRGSAQAEQLPAASVWQAVSLPHCYNNMDACDPDQPYYRGQGWYRTHLRLQNPFAEGRTLLHFRGAGQSTTLWIGGSDGQAKEVLPLTRIGHHKGGYDEFAFDLTSALASVDAAALHGGLPILVCCDNGPDLDRVPSDQSDFCLYGGLYRHVDLVYLPKLALDSVHLEPTIHADGSGELRISVRHYNPAALTRPEPLHLEILDPAGHVLHDESFHLVPLAAPEAAYQPLTRISVKTPQLWSPDAPHLYRCRVTLQSAAGQSRIEERFGFRTIEFVEHGPFKLNGKRLLLRGTQRHADHAGVAAAMSDEQVRQEMRMIRAMGANFVRLGHYQQDRLVLELCDELGLMVWEEAPWCRAGVGGEAFQEHARTMLAHMIDQHYNHPSVILWGLGNEIDWPGEYPAIDTKKIRAFLTEMRDLAHSLDGSRLTSLRRCDFARDIPDVYSPSIWAGWYHGPIREYEANLRDGFAKVKRFLHIEWGADSHATRHNEGPNWLVHPVPGAADGTKPADLLDMGPNVRMSRDGDCSETYACYLFDWHLKTQESLDWLTGSAQWAFKDFASPLRADSGIPNINQKGLVERDLRPKEGYYVFQSYWASEPMAHLYGHSWPTRWGQPDELRTVLLYSNCPEAELFLNGRSLGKRMRKMEDFPAAGLRWQATFQPGRNHLRAVAWKAGREVVDELAFEYHTEGWQSPAAIELAVARRQGNQLTVEARLVDAHGQTCLSAAQTMQFSFGGDGRLLDNLGTVGGSRRVQCANGRSAITVLLMGSGTLTATVAGVPAASLHLSPASSPRK